MVITYKVSFNASIRILGVECRSSESCHGEDNLGEGCLEQSVSHSKKEKRLPKVRADESVVKDKVRKFYLGGLPYETYFLGGRERADV